MHHHYSIFSLTIFCRAPPQRQTHIYIGFNTIRKYITTVAQKAG